MSEVATHAWGRLSPPMGTVVVGVATGTMAGMGAFMLTQSPLTPAPMDGRFAAVLVVLAGVYTHLLVEDIRRSVTAMIVALVVGAITLVAAWTAPLWILPYAPGARDVLLPGLLQRALASAMSTFLLLFLGSYLATLTVDGVLR